MKKIIIILLFFILTNQSQVFGQKQQSVLWKISGNGLMKDSYLFGTIHDVPFEIIQKFPKALKLINQADKGLFEQIYTGKSKVDPGLDKIINPPLDQVFTKEEYEIVDNFFSKTTYGSIKPHNKEASIGGMIQVVLLLKGNPGIKNEVCLDIGIYDLINQELKKEVFQLDDNNIANRKKVAKEVNPRIQAEQLLKLIQIEGAPSTKSEIKDNLYRSALKFKLNLNEEIPSSGPMQQAYKDAQERNYLWIPKIEKQIQSGSCFIAIGVGHLQYKTGIIQQLKDKGYKLAPVKLKIGKS